MRVAEPYYLKGKRGRPPRGIETMLRMYLLANWTNLSDEGVEDAIYDSYAVRKFLQVFLGNGQVPDATILCKFRKRLNVSGQNVFVSWNFTIKLVSRKIEINPG